MATRTFTVFIPLDAIGCNIPNAIGVKWAGLLNGDDGQPFVCGHRSIKSVQVYGTFGAAGSVQIQGTNDQTYTPSGGSAAPAPIYAPLSDQQANQLDIGVAKIEQVQENPSAVRPLVTAGDGATALTVTMLMTWHGR